MILSIRKARESDIATIYQLIVIATKKGKILLRSKAELKRTLRCFFVAESKNKLVGCCSIEVYNKKLAEVRSLTVHPKFQNHGIGSALVRRCIESARERKIYEVLVITDRPSLFKRYGFAEQLEGQFPLFLRP
ncbi:MAG: GNAT family N-acetyltransferase [Elusimicrobiota bacterium]